MLAPKEFLELQQQFVQYLTKNGYPEETVVLEFKVGKAVVDVAIVDPKLNTLIAVFGLKTKFENLKYEYDYLHGIKQLDNIPIFLVIPKDDIGFRVFRTFRKLDAGLLLASRGLEEVDLFDERNEGDIPSYRNILNRARSVALTRTKEAQDKTYDIFRIVCWVSAVAVLVFFLLDIFDKISLGATQLSLLALTVALVLLLSQANSRSSVSSSKD